MTVARRVVEQAKPDKTVSRGKARKLIEQGERVQDVAAFWNVGRTTIFRALGG